MIWFEELLESKAMGRNRDATPITLRGHTPPAVVGAQATLRHVCKREAVARREPAGTLRSAQREMALTQHPSWSAVTTQTAEQTVPPDTM